MLKDFRRPAAFFVFLLCLYSFGPKERAANQMSRFDLVRAIAVDHTFQVDKYTGNTMDLARFGGHAYSNKPPGVSLLAVPVTALNYWWQGIWAAGENWIYWNLWWAELFSTGLPAVWLVWMIYDLLLSWQPNHPDRAWKTAFVYAVGTSAFPFAMTMFGHQTTAAFTFATFYQLERSRADQRPIRFLLAGFFAGFAVITDYSTLLLAPLVLAWFAIWNVRRIPLFLVGAFPWLAMLGLYQWRCFGSPFTMAPLKNSAELPANWQDYPVAGVFGIPSPKAFFQLWFGLARGVFIFSPVLLLSILGWKKMAATEFRNRLGFCILPLVSFTLLFSGHIAWHGGGSSGPRYLLAAYPFWVLPMVFLPWSQFTYAVLALSVLNSCAVIAVTVLGAGDIFVMGQSYYFALTDIYYAYDFAALSIGCGVLYALGTKIDWIGAQ